MSDYDTPGKTGIEFLQTVRRDHPALPFILYTGKGSEAVAGDAISAGVTDSLQKEVGTDQYNLLANRTENAVEQRRNRRRRATLKPVRSPVNEINRSLIRASSRTAGLTRTPAVGG